MHPERSYALVLPRALRHTFPVGTFELEQQWTSSGRCLCPEREHVFDAPQQRPNACSLGTEPVTAAID